jgi:hypothetical protein
LYDDLGVDHASGDGDVDHYRPGKGMFSISRPLPIPSDLPRGPYEVVAELWRPFRIGESDADLLGEVTCGYLAVG